MSVSTQLKDRIQRGILDAWRGQANWGCDKHRREKCCHMRVNADRILLCGPIAVVHGRI
jgi:hypothetical protein